MKVISEGVAKDAKWWWGLRLTCPRCGRVVEIEKNDEHAEQGWDQVRVNEHAGRLLWVCRCGEGVTKEKGK